MAGRSRSMVAAHRLFAPGSSPARPAVLADQADEFDESDIWGSPSACSDGQFTRPASMATPKSKPRKQTGATTGPASLPVNIPDWSKILGAEYSRTTGMNRRSSYEGGEDSFDGGGGSDGDHDQWVPPHELLLCRNRAASSFSVHEGVGRTLKGRDLRRVRNAIWEKTGFQD